MYELLTKYIDIFDNEQFGTWVVDRDHRGSMEDPIQMPFVNYSKEVLEFEDAIYQFMDDHKEYGLNHYAEILEQNHLEWGEQSMREAAVDKLGDKCVMALLMGAVRGDRFCEGLVLALLKDGIIAKWLKRLQELEL